MEVVPSFERFQPKPPLNTNTIQTSGRPSFKFFLNKTLNSCT